MLYRIKSLLKKNNIDLKVNEVSLHQKKREIDGLSGELDSLNNELKSLAAFSSSLQPAGIINKETLMLVQRRQAGLKRKQAEIRLVMAQKVDEQRICQQAKGNILIKKQALVKKDSKYHHLLGAKMKARRFKETLADEHEIEEKIPWKK